MKGAALDVLHVTSAHSVRDTRIFVKQARSLSRQYRVGVLGPGQIDEVVEEHGISLHMIARPSGRFDRFTKFGQALYARIRQLSPQLVHLHDPDLLMLLPRLQRAGIRVIYDAHEDFSLAPLSRDWLGPRWVRRGVAGCFDHIERRLATRADGIVVADRQLQARFPGASVLRNFLVTEEWPDVGPRPKDRAIRCIYVGDITRARGVFRMCDAVEAGRAHGVALTLDLVGPITPILRAELEHHPARPHVTFHGPLSRRDVASHLAGAHVALCLPEPLPAYRTSLPVKLLEYLAMKLPVVVTDTARLRQEVSLAPGLMRVPWSAQPALLAGAIREAKKLPMQDRVYLRNHVLQKFSWAEEEKQLLALYSKVLAVSEPIGALAA
ncbi:MAG: glycosyltransferase family 4 protein [Litoreibacter sp.]|nr:glycosyltransferase family 4 protein [Litoreibacter sp.]